MALSLAHRPPMRRPGIALLFAVAGYGIATIVFGLSESFTLSFLMLALTGALDNISVVVRQSLVQLLADLPRQPADFSSSHAHTVTHPVGQRLSNLKNIPSVCT